jgi:hypothetical protein
MKRKLEWLAVLVVLACACMAFAGSVYDRTTKALSVTAGTGTWTNETDYAAIKLVRVWAENALATNAVVTVSRVTSDNTYTQTVGTVSCGTATSGNTATFTAGYLSPNDKLTFSSTVATGMTMVIEYEVQKH